MNKLFLGMDRSTVRQSTMFGEHICPVECLTKSLIFIVVTVFIMYMPLGDVHGYCEKTTCGRRTTTTTAAYLTTTHTTNNHVAVCCLCDMYKMMVKGARLAVHAVELLVYVLLDILYEAKLKFYSLLESLDRQDLCRSVCCRDDEAPKTNGVTEKRSNCRCSKSKMCKYKT
ncbi:uncharacterized protein LOC113493369 isoform X2 [Trichoplusia ni]|uniref:Uncharacterized protein LOC113493369 isoform X2 n=1 Tax=Trichoplusia ni TaxID=7111 RepID=A0A7E5VFV1_TRINI|nr:uncharacterized protein LOC113493369 isoform X2 [Trichoplusia ni]